MYTHAHAKEISATYIALERSDVLTAQRWQIHVCLRAAPFAAATGTAAGSATHAVPTELALARECARAPPAPRTRQVMQALRRCLDTARLLLSESKKCYRFVLPFD